jgi:hypothetical protein
MATKRSFIIIAAVAVLAIVGAVVLWRVSFRKTTVEIIAIDEGYNIRICASGRSIIPLTAEGPFPKWSELSWFTAEGPGQSVEREGIRYKKYSIGEDARCRISDAYCRGSLWISKDEKRLIVEAELSTDRRERGEMNHSGEYVGLAVDHPSITLLNSDTPTERVDGKYVRVRGRFIDKKNCFEAAGRSFPEFCAPYGCRDTDTYEVVGVFHALDVCYRNEPQLNIITIRKINER